MGLFVQDNKGRSELQERLNSQLQERLRQQGKAGETELNDHDPAFLHNTEKTSPFAWVWAVIILLAIGVFIWILIATAI